MKDVSDLLGNRLQRLEAPFSREWVVDFSSLMGFIQTNAFTQLYCGMMRTKYGLAKHRYEPLISTALYQQAQNVADGYHKKPHKKVSQPSFLRG